MKKGVTQKLPSGLKRAGTTPGGRSYSAVRTHDGGVRRTRVTSGITTWTKDTVKPDASTKVRDIHMGHAYAPKGQGMYHFEGVKGPTKPKAGFGKTHVFSDGGRLRTGTTPGGRKYMAVRFANPGKWSPSKTTKVGGLRKDTFAAGNAPGRLGKSSQKSSMTTGKGVLKGQMKPKGMGSNG